MSSQLPDVVWKAFIRYTSSAFPAAQPKLLPVQQKSYLHIAEGRDTVIFSPTGTGKTLAYILPLADRLLGWKRDGSLREKKIMQKQRLPLSKNDSLLSKKMDPARPCILVIEPSRELARQVGKIWTHFHPTATKSGHHVVTVYGGVPMARHASLLTMKTDVVVGTPGRIRELIREQYLSTDNLKSIVLDEADVMLNFKDVPEIEWLLDGMKNDYQLILASATINKVVDKFVNDVMELEVGEEGYIVVDSDEMNSYSVTDGPSAEPSDSVLSDKDLSNNIDKTTVSCSSDSNVGRVVSSISTSMVRHWAMAASATTRVTLACDLIVTIAPRRVIIFVPSKVEVESVAQDITEKLSNTNDVSIHSLHGDMIQGARSRTVSAFRGEVSESTSQECFSDSATFSSERSHFTRILVATDVASRGLDLPAVDLILQFGVPRKSGKDGTFDSELYIHRTGRCGRFGSTRTADAVLFYDRTLGEGKTLSKLQEEMKRLKDINILPRTSPSPKEVMDSMYKRAFIRCEQFHNQEKSKELVEHFKELLLADLHCEDGVLEGKLHRRESPLLDRLAAAMAYASGLTEAVPPRSLLTANSFERTIHVSCELFSAENPLTPSKVTSAVKALSAGKLGKIYICKDGSAVLDLSANRADTLLKNAINDSTLKTSGWKFEIPNSLPSIDF